jgi:Domain of unknown function (DUF4270)
VRAHKLFKTIFSLSILFFIYSCSKDGTDFIDDTNTIPLGAKVDSSFGIIGFNTIDSIRSIRNTSVVPFGTKVDASFGTFRSSFYASYQTTLTSKTFGFSSVDSIVLIIPYFSNTPKYGPCNQPFNVEVYEMTEGIETDPNSKKVSYAYSPLLLGSKNNFIPNISDSVFDGGIKTSPAIRITLNNSLASRIIAPGTYASDAEFQNVLKGLYVRSSSNNSTNGFVMLSIASDNVLRIYGKNTGGNAITADFTTGGSSSPTVSEYLHDNSSQAKITSLNTNVTSGDNLLYSHGLNGYVPVITLPNLTDFSKNKSIFKAELSIYILDTGVYNAGNLGLMYLDTTSTKEFVLPDELHRKGFLISTKDVTISGQTYKEYKYNIGMHLNRVLTNSSISKKIRIYSAPLLLSSSVTKFSDFIPTSVIIGGGGHSAKPKLKLYYTDI